MEVELGRRGGSGKLLFPQNSNHHLETIRYRPAATVAENHCKNGAWEPAPICGCSGKRSGRLNHISAILDTPLIEKGGLCSYFVQLSK